METLEQSLRETLNAFGYQLLSREDGFFIQDRETSTVYLGKKEPASLGDVRAFVDSLDEHGVPDLCGLDLEGEALSGALYLDEEITNLIRHRDTLRQQGDFSKAAELDQSIKELEGMLLDSEECDMLFSPVNSFLLCKGYRLETKSGGYRVTHKATGDIALGRNFEANVKDMISLAEELGMEPFMPLIK